MAGGAEIWVTGSMFESEPSGNVVVFTPGGDMNVAWDVLPPTLTGKFRTSIPIDYNRIGIT